MGLFTKDELALVDTLATTSKRLSDQERETLPTLLTKLGAIHKAEVPARFRALTGWSNRPKDYA